MSEIINFSIGILVINPRYLRASFGRYLLNFMQKIILCVPKITFYLRDVDALTLGLLLGSSRPFQSAVARDHPSSTRKVRAPNVPNKKCDNFTKNMIILLSFDERNLIISFVFFFLGSIWPK